LRARFLAESVWDLKTGLQGIGSDLVIRVGTVQDAVRSILDGFKDSNDVEVQSLWITSEEGWEERQEERQLKKLMEENEKEFELFPDEKYYINEYVLAIRTKPTNY
jgi:deoxyribodipyrimidine photo-lyase